MLVVEHLVAEGLAKLGCISRALHLATTASVPALAISNGENNGSRA